MSDGTKQPPASPVAASHSSVLNILKSPFTHLRSLNNAIPRLPKQCEVLIIGGGIVGSFAAYWVKRLYPSSVVVVIERDPDYTKSSTFWSVGGFRQQFSLPENIQMSMFGAEFLRNIDENLRYADGDVTAAAKVDVDINMDGYLFLASKEKTDLLYANHKTQLKEGAKVRLLNADHLKSTFKWINTEGVELGSFGYLNEGSLDPRKYLLAVRRAATYHGAHFVNGEVTSLDDQNIAKQPAWLNAPKTKDNINVASFTTQDGEQHTIEFANCVNAAGPWAANVARLAGVGADGLHDPNTPISSMSVSLPVEARKRYIYLFHAPNGPILNVPLTIDPSGVFFKRFSLANYYLAGLNPSPEDEPTDTDLDRVDEARFHEKIKPVLLKRCPSFGHELKLVKTWAGFYEYNTLDQNLIIGRHPHLTRLVFANGSSGHGLQHAPAIGRAISEIVAQGEYKTIDLTRFGFERVLKDESIEDIGVV